METCRPSHGRSLAFRASHRAPARRGSTAAKGIAGPEARRDEAYMRARRLDVFLARCAIITVVLLQFLTINNFAFGSPRLAPGVEIVLLFLIVILDARRQRLMNRVGSA